MPQTFVCFLIIPIIRIIGEKKKNNCCCEKNNSQNVQEYKKRVIGQIKEYFIKAYVIDKGSKAII